MNIRDQLQAATGLNLTQLAADRAVRRRLGQLGMADAASYLGQLSGAELNALVELVVVPESWMFRDADAFRLAVRVVRERLAAGAGAPLRIASVPCAGGEEPYSMAIALHQGGVSPGAFRIDAYDLSARALERARAARYSSNAFRGRNHAWRERYFSRVGDEFQLCEEIRSQVRFSQANLIDLVAETPYDLVFCRNLLIYFDEATTSAAIARLDALLAPNGLLFAGYAEVPAFCRNGFSALREAGAFALQRQQPGVVPAPPAARRKRLVAAAPAVARPLAAPRTLTAPAPPPDVASQLAQARQLADQARFGPAASACQAVLALAPDSAEAYFILGMISECECKSGVADQYWRRCIYLQPDHYEALCHLALLSEQCGNGPQAAAFKRRAARVYQRQLGGSIQ
ncbi:MAG: protein-glutamate O-methyltransferase CheR [Pseudomonadota bacterium]